MEVLVEKVRSSAAENVSRVSFRMVSARYYHWHGQVGVKIVRPEKLHTFGAKCGIVFLRLIPRLCGAVDLVEIRLIEEVPPSVLLR